MATATTTRHQMFKAVSRRVRTVGIVLASPLLYGTMSVVGAALTGVPGGPWGRCGPGAGVRDAAGGILGGRAGRWRADARVRVRVGREGAAERDERPCVDPLRRLCARLPLLSGLIGRRVSLCPNLSSFDLGRGRISYTVANYVVDMAHDLDHVVARHRR